MTNRLRLTLETRPKGKMVVAVAPDWPGLSWHRSGSAKKDPGPSGTRQDIIPETLPRWLEYYGDYDTEDCPNQ
jgi:hypothetical protein